MEESLEDEERILSLMRALNVRIRKAEEERDCALKRLQQLKSILDCSGHKSLNRESNHPVVEYCPRLTSEIRATPLPKKTTIEVSPDALRNSRAHDSGLASTLVTESDRRHTVSRNVDWSPTSSERRDLCSLKFASTTNGPVQQTPIRVLNGKMSNFPKGNVDSGGFGNTPVNPGSLLASETVLPPGSIPFEEVLESNSDSMFLGCVRPGDTIIPRIDTRSPTEDPAWRVSKDHHPNNIRNMDGVAVSKPVSHSPSSIPRRQQELDFVNQLINDDDSRRTGLVHRASTDTGSASNAICESPELKLTRVMESPVRTRATETNFRLPQMLRSKWSNLKPLYTDTPVTVARRPVATTGTKASLCQSISQQTTSTAELRRQVAIDEQYLSAPEREFQYRVEPIDAKQATSGTVSPQWLRQLISRLEKLSNTYQTGHSVQTPAVRCKSEHYMLAHARPRHSFSCSPRRSRLNERRSSMTSQGSLPLRFPNRLSSSRRSPEKLQSIGKSTTTRRRNCNLDYPVFVPIDYEDEDEIKHKRSLKSTKPSTTATGSRRTASVKPTFGCAPCSPKIFPVLCTSVCPAPTGITLSKA